MGVWLLHDDEADRAIIFDSTSERPLNCPAFIGADAREQGEAFFGWLAWRSLTDEIPGEWLYQGLFSADPTNPRCYTRDGLDAARSRFGDECYDKHDHLNELGWALQRWQVEGQREDETDELDKVLAAGGRS